MTVGSDVAIMQHCYIGSKNLRIGNSCFINHDVIFDGDIFIEDNCNIAFNVSFITSTHKIGDLNRRAGKKLFKPIIVKKGSWIGANVVILPGISIGEGVIIGAGSVVTRDCEANAVYAGNPARLIRRL